MTNNSSNPERLPKGFTFYARKIWHAVTLTDKQTINNLRIWLISLLITGTISIFVASHVVLLSRESMETRQILAVLGALFWIAGFGGLLLVGVGRGSVFAIKYCWARHFQTSLPSGSLDPNFEVLLRKTEKESANAEFIQSLVEQIDEDEPTRKQALANELHQNLIGLFERRAYLESAAVIEQEGEKNEQRSDLVTSRNSLAQLHLAVGSFDESKKNLQLALLQIEEAIRLTRLPLRETVPISPTTRPDEIADMIASSANHISMVILQLGATRTIQLLKRLDEWRDACKCCRVFLGYYGSVLQVAPSDLAARHGMVFFLKELAEIYRERDETDECLKNLRDAVVHQQHIVGETPSTQKDQTELDELKSRIFGLGG